MEFQFEFDRALQAAAYLLQIGRGEMTANRLLCLLYLAEREWLAKATEPLTGDRIEAGKSGPNLSTVLDLTFNTHPRSKEWRRCVWTIGYDVELRADPGYEKLSGGIMAKLNEVYHRCYEMSDYVDLTLYMQRLPEWQWHYEEGAGNSIPWRDVLKAQGMEEMISLVECR